MIRKLYFGFIFAICVLTLSGCDWAPNLSTVTTTSSNQSDTTTSTIFTTTESPQSKLFSYFQKIGWTCDTNTCTASADENTPYVDQLTAFAFVGTTNQKFSTSYSKDTNKHLIVSRKTINGTSTNPNFEASYFESESYSVEYYIDSGNVDMIYSRTTTIFNFELAVNVTSTNTSTSTYNVYIGGFSCTTTGAGDEDHCNLSRLYIDGFWNRFKEMVIINAEIDFSSLKRSIK